MITVVYLSLAAALAAGPAESVLAEVSILPEWLAQDGDTLRVTLTGHCTVDSAPKQVAAWFGATRVAIIPSPAAPVQGGWTITLLISRVGPELQWSMGSGMVLTQAFRALSAAPEEDLSRPVPLVVTGFGGVALRLVMIERLVAP